MFLITIHMMINSTISLLASTHQRLRCIYLPRMSTIYGADIDPIRAKVEAPPTATFRTCVIQSGYYQILIRIFSVYSILSGYYLLQLIKIYKRHSQVCINNIRILHIRYRSEYHDTKIRILIYKRHSPVWGRVQQCKGKPGQRCLNRIWSSVITI